MNSTQMYLKGERTPVLVFRALEDTGLVRHCFSTRYGGVSKGNYSSMNLSFTRGDERENVAENYKRIGLAIDSDNKDMVATYQTHTTNIRKVSEKDRGIGVTREKPYRDVDGLICDIPGITLVTYHADCASIFVLDPLKKAVGLAHAGWKGTASLMGKKIVSSMIEAFGCSADDMICCIGPCICGRCYEVGEDVAGFFSEGFWQDRGLIEEIPGAAGKYLLDIEKANIFALSSAGVKAENIHASGMCTMESDMFFSHRRMGEDRGSCAAFLGLR